LIERELARPVDFGHFPMFASGLPEQPRSLYRLMPKPKRPERALSTGWAVDRTRTAAELQSPKKMAAQPRPTQRVVPFCQWEDLLPLWHPESQNPRSKVCLKGAVKDEAYLYPQVILAPDSISSTWSAALISKKLDLGLPEADEVLKKGIIWAVDGAGRVPERIGGPWALQVDRRALLARLRDRRAAEAVNGLLDGWVANS
jgi:hypothetical protein